MSAPMLSSSLSINRGLTGNFEIEVEGDRTKIEDYSLWKSIVLHFKIKGKVDFDKADKAIKLSLDKYCSVSKTLEPTATITYKLSVN